MKIFYLILFLIFQINLFAQSQTICDLSANATFLDKSQRVNFKSSDKLPDFLADEVCVKDALSNQIHYSKVFSLYLPVAFEDNLGFGPISLRGRGQAFLFKCICPDPSIDLFCENKNQECLGEIDGVNFSFLDAGLYYVLFTTPIIGETDFKIIANPFSRIELQIISCGYSSAFSIGSESSWYNFNNTYSTCYSGNRAFEGNDTAFVLDIEVPSIVDVRLSSNLHSGLFLLEDLDDFSLFGQCFYYAEMADSNSEVKIESLFLTTGTYVIVIDNDEPGSEPFIDFSIECSPVTDPKFFLNQGDRNCPINDNSFYKLNIPLSSNTELLSQNPNLYFSYNDESNKERIIDNSSTTFLNNEIFINLPSDESGDSKKCSYKEDELIKILLGDKNSSNVIYTLEPTFDNSEGLFQANQIGSIENLEIKSRDGFNVSPSQTAFSKDSIFYFPITINPSFLWTYSINPSNNWLSLDFRTPPVRDGVFRGEPNFIFLTLDKNDSQAPREANIEIISAKNNFFKYTFNVKQLGSSLSQNENFSKKNEIKIYPNPTNGKISIESKNTLNGDSKISLIDIFGRIVKKFEVEISRDIINLDLDNLNSGIYMISINSGNEKFSKKIIIN